MTNTQFYVALGIPFFTILVVWIGSTVANRSAINDLRSEIKIGFDAVNHRLGRLETMVDRIDNEIRVGHEHRLTVLEKKVLSRAS